MAKRNFILLTTAVCLTMSFLTVNTKPPRPPRLPTSRDPDDEYHHIYKYRALEGRTQYEWDPSTETELQFYVKICGHICNGTQYMHLEVAGWPPVPVCKSACFPCDCSQTCAIYGTCCPQFHSDTPLAEKDKRKKAGSTAGVNFIGTVKNYDFIDVNNYIHFVEDNPELAIEPAFGGRFKCMRISWPRSKSYYALTDCPIDTDNDTLKMLCESDHLELDSTTLDLASPIIDERNGIVFKNQYCLQCNVFNGSAPVFINSTPREFNASTSLETSGPYRKWKVAINCPNYQRFYKLTSAGDFLRAVFKDATENLSSSHCIVLFELPHSQVPPRMCGLEKFSESPVGEVHPTRNCNLELGVYSNIRRFCDSLTQEAYRVYQRQNAFCYMCVDDFPTCTGGRSIDDGLYVTSYMSFLFGESSAVKVIDSQNKDPYLCKGSLEWMDEEGTCRLPGCTEGKRLEETDCKSVVGIIGRLGYKVTAILIPTQEILIDGTIEKEFIIQLAMHYFGSTNTAGIIDIEILVYGRKHTLNGSIRYVTMSGYLVSSHSTESRDDFEKSFLDYSFQFVSDEGSVKQSATNFTAVYLGSDMASYLRYSFGDRDSAARESGKRSAGRDSQNKTESNALNKTVMALYTRQFNKENRANIEPKYEGDGSISYKKGDLFDEPLWKMKESFIDLTHSLVCPHVSFHIAQIHTVSENGEISVQFNYLDKKYSLNAASLHYKNSISIVGREIKICIDTFRRDYQNVEDHYETNSPFTISLPEKGKRFFAMVCFLLSVVCLILTIITYFIFPQLRTLPGLNTLMLSISLAIAQIFLVIVVESVGYIHGWLCIGLGMGLHFSWLVACQWMGVCCYHMFSVFRETQAPSNSQRSHIRHTFQWYSFYAFGSSAVIVSLTIIMSEILSGSKTTGYSSDVCYFDNAWSPMVALLSFFLPVSLVSITNLVMFVITVKEIMEVTRLQDHGRLKGRNGVVTYVKLSSLTGLFWLLTILAIKLNSIVLEFISIPFVALQGLFIFLSFTLNAHTRKLYSQRLGWSKESQSAVNATSAPTGLTHAQEPEKSRRPFSVCREDDNLPTTPTPPC